MTTKSDQEFKADAGKTEPDLLEQGFPRALRLVQATLDYGKKKYEAHSWQKVPNAIARYNKASRRHRQERDLEASPADGFHAILEATDAESGLPHIAHEIVCLLMLIELDLAANVGINAANNALKAIIGRMKEPPTDHKNPAVPDAPSTAPAVGTKQCGTCAHYMRKDRRFSVCKECWPAHCRRPSYDKWVKE